jgi:uncharacterized protein (DUF4213/DUF364 family)
MEGTIVDQTLELLRDRRGEDFSQLTITDVRIGLHFTAVQLSDGSCGVAGTMRPAARPLDKSQRRFGAFSPAQIRGRSIRELFAADQAAQFNRSLTIAAMNALSAPLLVAPDYEVREDTDPLDLFDFGPGRRVVIVGAFQSYIKRVAASGAELQVLEFREEALQAAHRSFFTAADDYARALPTADLVIITGQTLANGTLDQLLQAVHPGAEVMVTGPTASFLPDVLFRHQVKAVGAVRFTDPAQPLAVAGEGGSGYHLFRYGAEKICLSPSRATDQ